MPIKKTGTTKTILPSLSALSSRSSLSSSRPIRVLLAKAGLDGHDRGVKVIARGLRDAGMEVIYTGLHQSPEQVVATAVQENVEAMGVSMLSGAHMELFKKIIVLMKKQKLQRTLLFGGGTIPESDIPFLKKLGVQEVFIPGTSIQAIVDYLNHQLRRPKK